MSSRLHGYDLGQAAEPAVPQESAWAKAWPAVISGAVEAVVGFMLLEWLLGRKRARR